MKSCEKSRKSREKSRRSDDKSLKSDEKSRKGLEKSRKSCGKSKNEILKLKELQNERLEGSWGALWLGIRMFFGFKLGVVGLQGEEN